MYKSIIKKTKIIFKKTRISFFRDILYLLYFLDFYLKIIINKN